jgi:hypothetical protein
VSLQAAIDWIAAMVLGTVCLASPWWQSSRSPEPHTDKHAACEMKVLDSLLPPSTPERPDLGGSNSGRLCRGGVLGLVEAELDPAGRVVAVSSPQPWSLIGLAISTP